MNYERKGGVIVAFDVSGHAGTTTAGRNIVCAAVSALIFSTAYGLRRHCKQRAAVTDDGARYSVRLGGSVNARSQALLETMLSGLKAIARSYPGYIKMQSGRVRATGPGASLANRKISKSGKRTGA